jgi:hypothetical protein
MRFYNYLPVSILGFLVLSFIGCTKDNPMIETKTVYVNQPKIFLCWVGSSTSNAKIYSDPVADVGQSTVTMSWATNSVVFDRGVYEPGYIEFWRLNNDRFGDTLITIVMTSNVGNCSGTVKVPSPTNFIFPNNNDTLPLGSVNCKWLTAANAEWYDLSYFTCGYDTINDRWLNKGWIDTFVVSDSLIIPASFFDLPNVGFYDIAMLFQPYSGPKPQAGTVGNMAGDMKGFLVGQGEGWWIHFYIGSAKGIKPTRMPIPKRVVSKYNKRYFEKIGIEYK